MKNMKISLKMKGDVMSNQFLMLWFQKDSLDTDLPQLYSFIVY